MGFPYEPCPWCGNTEIKMIKSSHSNHNLCYVQCKTCKMRLVMSGKSMMDCARTWNVRASRRAEMKKQNMTLVSLLHADIAHNTERFLVVSLDNSNEMWQIALAAETASNMDAAPVRMMDKPQFEIRYEVLFPYLDALVRESAEKVPEPEPDLEGPF